MTINYFQMLSYFSQNMLCLFVQGRKYMKSTGSQIQLYNYINDETNSFKNANDTLML